MKPKTIRIFLPDGSPHGIKIAELTNRVVQAILIPRNRLLDANGRQEVENVGFYVLFGDELNEAKSLCYIGEAENCLKRLKQHNRSKDFWNYAIIFISKINAFTKSHVKYLEHLAIKKAKSANRFIVTNDVDTSKPFVTESMEADLSDNFETIEILISTLGYPLFDIPKFISKKNKFKISARGVEATGSLVDEGFVVFRGSESSASPVDSLHNYVLVLQSKLVESKVLVKGEKPGTYTFVEDYVFNSPSTAGAVVIGRTTNGWQTWKDSNGKTLDEIMRKTN